MENEQEKCVCNSLFEDFLDLGEKYRDQYTIPDFAYLLMGYIYMMMFDTAPSKEAVKELSQEAMKWGYELHLKGGYNQENP